MTRRFRTLQALRWTLVFTAAGCSDGGDPQSHDDRPNGDEGPNDGGDVGETGGPGGCVGCNMPRPTAPRLNLDGAVGLAITASQTMAMTSTHAPSHFAAPGAVYYAAGNDSGGETGGDTDGDDVSGEESVWKIGDDGMVEPGLEEGVPQGGEQYSQEQIEQMWDPGPLPRVVAVGFSPDASAYVLFERPFMYRYADPSETMINTWDAASPYTCQLFRTHGDWTQAAQDDSLECVTNQHEIPMWQSTRLMQFDIDGRLYFPAMVPGTSKQVFYAYDPVDQSLTEKVNANICWHDVEVTPGGGIFYTGTSKTDGDCNGTSFFRYVSPASRLIEIARDWWDFKYIQENNPDDPDSEGILFYGPDPRAEGTIGWETACLYRFDPTNEDPDTRTTKVTECVNDFWSWIGIGGSNNPSLAERRQTRERCELDGKLFVGGQGVSELAQAQDGTLYLVGDLQLKVAGNYLCSLQIESDHCDSLDPAHTEQTACENAGFNWVRTQSWCSDPTYTDEASCWGNGHSWNFGMQSVWYNDVEGDACLVTDVEADADPAAGVHYLPGWQVQYHSCTSPDPTDPSGWTRTVPGIAYLEGNPATQQDLEVRLLSDTEEEVEQFWMVEVEGNLRFYYSIYEAGTYQLRMVEHDDAGVPTRKTILEGYEVYNVTLDPAAPSHVLFDGLHFETNQYLFGSLDPNLATAAEIAQSIEVKSGLTGQIETLIILPQF